MELTPKALLDMSEGFQTAANNLKTDMEQGQPEFAETRLDGIISCLDDAARCYGWAYLLVGGLESEVRSKLEAFAEEKAKRLAELLCEEEA